MPPYLRRFPLWPVLVGLLPALSCRSGSSAAKPQAAEVGEMVLIPAGRFTMGSIRLDTDTRPPHTVELDSFYIDRYEATNADYQRFMWATGHPRPEHWDNPAFNQPRQPVVGVSWEDARAYCEWAGKRLPTEAEWEKAARGTDGRPYPWGHRWEGDRANHGIGMEPWYDESDGYRYTAPIGGFPGGASPYGVQDMAGNVWEWCADWYSEDYYQNSPLRNPQGPDRGSGRVRRGGSWANRPNHLHTAYRLWLGQTLKEIDVGFRCAK